MWPSRMFALVLAAVGWTLSVPLLLLYNLSRSQKTPVDDEVIPDKIIPDVIVADEAPIKRDSSHVAVAKNTSVEHLQKNHSATALPRNTSLGAVFDDTLRDEPIPVLNEPQIILSSPLETLEVEATRLMGRFVVFRLPRKNYPHYRLDETGVSHPFVVIGAHLDRQTLQLSLFLCMVNSFTNKGHRGAKMYIQRFPGKYLAILPSDLQTPPYGDQVTLVEGEQWGRQAWVNLSEVYGGVSVDVLHTDLSSLYGKYRLSKQSFLQLRMLTRLGAWPNKFTDVKPLPSN